MKILKRIALVISAAVVIFLLSGCAHSHELKNLNVLTALGIDKTSGEYEVYAQVLKADQATMDSNGDSYRYFGGKGATFDDAVAAIYAQGSGELTFAHNKLYLFGYDALEDAEDLRSVLLDKNYDIRPQSYCVVTKNKTEYFMTTADEYGFDCNYKLLEILDKAENAPTVNDVLQALANGKENVVIPVVEVSEGVVSIERWLTVSSSGVVTATEKPARAVNAIKAD